MGKLLSDATEKLLPQQQELESIKSIIYIYDKNFNNRYFITLEVTLIHTVDIEDNKYLKNIMEKVIPKSKTKFLQNIYIVCWLKLQFTVNGSTIIYYTGVALGSFLS